MYVYVYILTLSAFCINVKYTLIIQRDIILKSVIFRFLRIFNGNSCNLSICVISKRRSSIGQTLINIKHEVNGKSCQNTKFTPTTPYSHMVFFLHMVFTFFVNILEKFLNKPKFNCFKKNVQTFYTHYLHNY